MEHGFGSPWMGMWSKQEEEDDSESTSGSDVAGPRLTYDARRARRGLAPNTGLRITSRSSSRATDQGARRQQSRRGVLAHGNGKEEGRVGAVMPEGSPAAHGSILLHGSRDACLRAQAAVTSASGLVIHKPSVPRTLSSSTKPQAGGRSLGPMHPKDLQELIGPMADQGRKCYRPPKKATHSLIDIDFDW